MLQLDNEGRKCQVHHEKLKKYEGNTPPKWATNVRLKLLKRQEKEGQKQIFFNKHEPIRWLQNLHLPCACVHI